MGDPVSVLPDRVATRVRSLRMGTADLPAARRGQSVLLADREFKGFKSSGAGS